MTDISLLTLNDVLSSLEIDLSLSFGIAFETNTIATGYNFVADQESVFWTIPIEPVEELLLTIPGIDGFGFVVKELARIDLLVGPTSFIRLRSGSLAFRLPNEILKPVKLDDDGNWQQEEKDGELGFREIEIGVDATVLLDMEGNMIIDLPFDDGITPSLSLKPTMLGDTGIVIEAENLALTFAGDKKGISFAKAAIYLPPDLPAAPDLSVTNCFIGQHGFSGVVAADWQLDDILNQAGEAIDIEGELVGELFGFQGGLGRVAIEFRENWPIASDIQGKMIIPYFEGVVDISIELRGGGEFYVTLLGAGENGVTLTKAELLTLNFKSLRIESDPPVGKIIISGGLEPLLMGGDGLEWPRLDVTDLSIEQDFTTTGQDLTTLKPPLLTFREAWLDLKEIATLDLWGFHFELNRVGIGYEELEDKFWIDLTGKLKLIDQLPIGLGVEGFRITWPRLLYEEIFEELNVESFDQLDLAGLMAIAQKIEVRFDGVFIFYGIPGSVEFEGYIRFIKEAQKIGFAGDVVLRVPSSGLSIEAGLLVGMNFADPPYPFLYVYFGLELPSGIPLGQSGLALKGALGLFGLNVTPDKTPEQNWYYDWYKREPFIGAHQTNKWRDERWAIALGIGVTITTVDGYIVGVRGLLVLALPGPFIMIEGRALVFDGLLPMEPPLRALAIIDGREQFMQLNIEAGAELIEDMLEANGVFEAFFDFNDLTNWHLYLGQDEPLDRRVQANILKFGKAYLFRADAYLMLDMINAYTVRARMGVLVGFKPNIPSFPPVSITLDAVLEGRGVVTVLPEQFSGDMGLEANLTLTAFGFGLQMTANADVLTEGPDPFSVAFTLHVKAELPLPQPPIDWLQGFVPFSLEPFENLIPALTFEAELDFSWQTESAPKIGSPLVTVAANGYFVSGERELPLYIGGNNNEIQKHAMASPVVPLDARPTLMFNHDMADADGNKFARAVVHPLSYNVGSFAITPTLVKVELWEHKKEAGWNGAGEWKLIADSYSANKEKMLYGTWLAEAAPTDPDKPALRRLRLWATNPFMHVLEIGQKDDELYYGSFNRMFLRDYPDAYNHQKITSPEICIDFIKPASSPPANGNVWYHQGVSFWPEFSRKIALADDCLQMEKPGEGHLHIRFPETVRRVVIHLCELDSTLNTTPLDPKSGRLARTLEEFNQIRDDATRERIEPDFNACRFDAEIAVEIEDKKITIEAQEGFNCLRFPRMERRLREICYITQSAATLAEQTAQNADTYLAVQEIASEEPGLFKRGCYYRLKVTSQVQVELPPGENPLLDIYSGAMNLLGLGDNNVLKFTQEAYFQTDAPPQNLAPYVKWASPQAELVFRADDMIVRFKRPYIKTMYAEFPLQMIVRDMNGNQHVYKTTWKKAGTATLLNEERLWLTHRGKNPNDPNVEIPKDDVLYGTPQESDFTLEPSTRYELLIYQEGEDGTPLYQLPFMTSSFHNFDDLVASKDQFVDLPTINVPSSEEINAILLKQELLEQAKQAAYEARIRFESELLDREGYETYQLKLRNARQQHDAMFRTFASAMGVSIFDPRPERLQIYRLLNENGQLIGFWLRSPESLDIVNNSHDIGRTVVKFHNNIGAGNDIEWHTVHNADATEVIIIYKVAPSSVEQKHGFEFIYRQDFGDDQTDRDHLFDRPIRSNRMG